MVPAQIATPSYAALLPRGIWGQIADSFDYVAEFLPIVAGASVNFDIGIQNDSDFLIVQAVAQVTATDDQTSVAFFPALVTHTDTGAGRNLESRAQHFHNFFANGAGAAGLVHYLPIPKLIDRGSQFSVRLQSLFAATNVNVRISYQGFKLFGPRRSDVGAYSPTDLVAMARALLEKAAIAAGG